MNKLPRKVLFYFVQNAAIKLEEKINDNSAFFFLNSSNINMDVFSTPNGLLVKVLGK